jgi:cytochrome c oxidase subunit 6b
VRCFALSTGVAKLAVCWRRQVSKHNPTLTVAATCRTAKVDMRFHSTNQARACYTRYNEYYKCMQQDGDEAKCAEFRRAALSLCPMDWIEKWEDQRGEGTWPGKY